MRRRAALYLGFLVPLAAIAAVRAPALRAAPVVVTSVQPGDRTVRIEWLPVPGDTLTVEERRSDASRLFGGYVVWRGTSPDTTKMIRLRTYSMFDSTWTFVGNVRRFVDPDSVIRRGFGEDEDDPPVIPGPFNGFSMYYAITSFDATVDTLAGVGRVREIPIGGIGEAVLTPVFPQAVARTATPLLQDVVVVPNPYDRSEPWDVSGVSRVQFIHLPTPAKIEIYTTAGDLVRELEHTDTTDSENWDLRNGDGREVVSGIYVFYVKAGSGETTRGHFVVVR